MEDVETTYKTVVNTISSICDDLLSMNVDSLKLKANKVIINIKCTILDWMKNMASGSYDGSYQIGVLSFDVIFTALSFGTGASVVAAKNAGRFAAKIAKPLSFIDDYSFTQKLYNQFDNIPVHIGKLNGQAKKVTQSKYFKCQILGKGCFMKDTPVAMSSKQFRNIPAAYALAAMPLVAPIQNIQPDDIVIAHKHEASYYATASNDDDLYVPGWQDYDYLDITPETWQIGKFIITVEDGNLVEIEANRPKKWFQDYELKEKGDKAFIVIEEMGISDYAVLQSIRPTVIDTRDYALNESGQVERPVITTYKRIANEISDYTFSNGQIISCTANHPFYSSDRQAYVPVGELTFGETVQTAGEREVKFIGGKAREKGEHVYNFEVWREHNYYVGFEASEEFVLVHNSCWDIATKVVSGAISKAEIWAMKGFPAIFKRGGIIEQIIRKGKYTKSKGWGYTGVGDGGLGKTNYWLIDFFKGNRVVSLKSTTVKNGSDWATSNAQHIRDLSTRKIQGSFPNCKPGPNCINPSHVIDNITEAELHIVVEKLSDINKNDWITAIKSKLPVGEKDNIIITITEL